MKQKFLEIGQGKISYYEANENARCTLFFIHGNSGSSLMWSKQFSGSLREDYRLVAIDLPGHGDSFHSKNPIEDYSPLGTAKILSSVITYLATNNQFILIGFSYGTNLIAEMINYGIRPGGIVLIGSCVLGNNHGMGKVFLQNEQPSIFFYNENDRKVIERWFFANLIKPDKNDFQNVKNGYLKVSPEFKPVLFKAAGEGNLSDEIQLLHQLNIPVLILFGVRDGLVNINYLDDFPFPVWQNHIYKLSDAGHWVNIDEAEEFNSIVSNYVQKMFKLSRV